MYIAYAFRKLLKSHICTYFVINVMFLLCFVYTGKYVKFFGWMRYLTSQQVFVECAPRNDESVYYVRARGILKCVSFGESVRHSSFDCQLNQDRSKDLFFVCVPRVLGNIYSIRVLIYTFSYGDQ
jgi:hypothetical protein